MGYELQLSAFSIQRTAWVYELHREGQLQPFEPQYFKLSLDQCAKLTAFSRQLGCVNFTVRGYRYGWRFLIENTPTATLT
jgi:hypothetical protein